MPDIIQTCRVSGEKFVITEADQEFYKRVSPKIGDTTYEIPLPTLCPQERQRRRIAWRNFRSLYHRKCDATGKKLITMYSSDKTFPVYENAYWWSDAWDALDYGTDFDFSRPFFEQYRELMQQVPRFATFNLSCDNCIYANFAMSSRNCYLVFGCVRSEDCLYGHIVWDSKCCINNLYLFRCELCSNCVDCLDSYNLHFSTECASCTDSYFLHDCRACRNCFGCVNLRNKEYYIFNKPYSKEDYAKEIKKYLPLNNATIANCKAWLGKTKKEYCVFPSYFGFKNENVSGNHIYESKNVHHSFDVKKGEDSKFLYTSYEQIDSYDISFTGSISKFCYECLTIGNSETLFFSHGCIGSHNLMYCTFCYNSHDLFACDGLRNKQYCIFNKQYSKEEYEKLVPKIIEHMKKEGEFGEFFPMEISPFAYNESIVNEYFPLTKKEILAKNLRWKDDEDKGFYDGQVYEPSATIEAVGDDVCEKILKCEVTGKPYKIIPQELKFHKQMRLPLPRRCPDQRHLERMAMRTVRLIWDRTCGKCGTNIQTSFAPDRPEKVYCEACYLKAVY